MTICGRKTITPPTPAMIPSTMRSRSGPSLITPPTHSPRAFTPASIRSIGYCPRVKVKKNISPISSRKSGKPHRRLVTMSSMWSVSVRLPVCLGK